MTENLIGKTVIIMETYIGKVVQEYVGHNGPTYELDVAGNTFRLISKAYPGVERTIVDATPPHWQTGDVAVIPRGSGHNDIRVRRADGKWWDAEGNMAVLDDEGAEFNGYVLVLRDGRPCRRGDNDDVVFVDEL